MTATTHLLLIRHGESTWNVLQRWQGQADPPLSPLGERQARWAAERLAVHGPFDVVITSTLQRSRRTGELLAQGANLVLGTASAGLAERAGGLWEGLTPDEMERSFPGFLDSGCRPDGFEDDDALVARATAALGVLAEEHSGRRLLVVSHAGVINALERHAEASGVDASVTLGNLEGRWFDHVPGRLNAIGSRVQLLDDT